MTRSSARSLSRLIALILLGAVLALAIGEIVARAVSEDGSPASDVERADLPPGLPEITTIRELTRPSNEGIYRGAYYLSNSVGFRGREFTAFPAEGVTRIAIIGDSFTMGDGVAEEEAYPWLLEHSLNQRGQGEFEVLNFGLSGINVHQAVERGKRLAERFHVDLLIYGLTVNDIEGPHYRKTADADGFVEQRARFARFANSPSYLLRVLWPQIAALDELRRPRPGTYLHELMVNYFDNPEAWRDFTKGLDDLAAAGEELERPPIVFIHTLLVYLNWLHPLQPIYSKVDLAAHSRGFAVIHSLPEHFGHQPERLWVSLLDAHPNPAGHRILAAALEKGLDDLGVLGAAADQDTYSSR